MKTEFILPKVSVYDQHQRDIYIKVAKEQLKEICRKHGLKWSLAKKTFKLAQIDKAHTLIIDLDRVPEEFKVKMPYVYYEKLRVFEAQTTALLEDNERLRNDLKRFLDEAPHG